MTKVLFNRKDAQVQEDAKSLSYKQFEAIYKDQTTEAVLKKVWETAQAEVKKTKVVKKIENKADEAVDMPQTTSEFKSDDGDKVVSKKKGKTTIVEIESAEEPVLEKKSKKDKGTQVDESKPTRATRLRELIAKGKEKSAAREILIKEGYDCGASFHSEWNRLNK